MKELSRIKYEYAKEQKMSFDSWNDLVDYFIYWDQSKLLEAIDEVAKRYAISMCKETQRRCADKALMVDQYVKVYTRHWNGLKIYEESILSETNIPKEVKS